MHAAKSFKNRIWCWMGATVASPRQAGSLPRVLPRTLESYSRGAAHSASAAAASSKERMPMSSASSLGLTGTLQAGTGQTPAAAATVGAARGPRRPRATAAHAAQKECSQRVERHGRPRPNGRQHPPQSSDDDSETAASLARVAPGLDGRRGGDDDIVGDGVGGTNLGRGGMGWEEMGSVAEVGWVGGLAGELVV